LRRRATSTGAAKAFKGMSKIIAKVIMKDMGLGDMFDTVWGED